NITLITCILGMGLGVLVWKEKPFSPSRFFFLLALLVAITQLFGSKGINLPLASEGHFMWNGLSRSIKGTWLQYLALFFFVSRITLVFVPLGKMLGREFDKLKPIPAYTINVGGAIAGIAVFALFSKMGLSPVVWFATGAAITLLLLPLQSSTILGAILVLVLS